MYFTFQTENTFKTNAENSLPYHWKNVRADSILKAEAYIIVLIGVRNRLSS